MVSDEKFVTKTSKGEELDGKKAPGRTGAERTGKLRLRACYFVGCGMLQFADDGQKTKFMTPRDLKLSAASLQS